MGFFKDAIYENFVDWVMRFNQKTFDLTLPKEDVAEQFTDRLLIGYYKNINDLYMAILKSYIITKEDEVADFVVPEDLVIKKPVSLINKFLNEYVTDEKVECKNKNDVINTIAGLIFEDCKNTFGSVIYLEMVNQKFKAMPEVKSAVIDLYKKDGYVAYTKDPRFLIGTKKESRLSNEPRQQKRLLDAYISIVDNYIKNYKVHINKNFTEEQYNKLWSVVRLCLNNIEDRLTENFKLDEKYIVAKNLTDKFFKTKQEEVRKALTRAGRHGDYCLQIKESIKKFASGNYEETDVQNLNEFYDRLKVLKKALSITDSNNKNYPTNYFVCMPIHPLTAIDLISKFQKSGFLTKEQESNVSLAKRLIRESFPFQYMANNGDVEDVKSVLLAYKHKTVFPNGQVKDLSSDESYAEFVKEVEDYLVENKLPKNSVCISSVAHDMIRDREPINMGKKETEKELTPVM